MFLIGDTHRSISSTAVGRVARGRSARARHWSGCRSSWCTPAGDHVAGGLVAADEDEQRLLHDVVGGQALAVDLGVDEDAHQVVGGLRPGARR